MRVALVHDWLTGMRGGEKVLGALAEMFAQADLFTLIHARGACAEIVQGRRVTTSFLNRFPGARRYYRHLLPLMPRAIERLDLGAYDLVISSSHCVAKGVRRAPAALHVCYCHAPMRYVWGQSREYARRMPWMSRAALAACRGYLRDWDLRSAAGVDLFVANSHNVAGHIQRIYGRDSTVIEPPIDTDFLTIGPEAREDFYLVVSALAPYKCIDHAVEAFTALKRPLCVIGAGPMLKRLRRRAGPGVRFLGWQSDAVVRDHYRRCRALIFPGEEDFGLTPLEAMACGAPVIAAKAGGAMETVVDNVTGILYEPRDAQGLADAVRRFEGGSARFETAELRRWALRFAKLNFQTRFGQFIRDALANRVVEPRMSGGAPAPLA